MNTQTQAQVKTTSISKPSFIAVPTGLLQRKCAYGGNAGVDGECEECRKNRLSVQRRATNSATPSRVPSIVHEMLRSPGQALDAATRAFMEPRFGHDFSSVRVHTDASQMFPGLIISASPETPQEGIPATPVKIPVSNRHPLSAFPLEARTETQSCGVPSGQHGAAKAIRFRIADFDGQPVTSDFTVTEEFSRLEGPDDVFKKLSRGSKQAEKGFFNDCYRLFQPTPLPEDFRLKVEQHHLIDKEIISKNHITYTPTSVTVCVFPRHARERNFGSRCKIY